MYPRISQPLTKTVVRTKSPIRSSKTDTPLKNTENSQSKNKLHSPHSLTPTKTPSSSSSSRPKSPQQLLKSFYSHHNSVSVGNKGTTNRTQASPLKSSFTEQDSAQEYRSLTTRSPLKTHQTVGQYNYMEEQENRNYQSHNSRRTENYMSSSLRDRENMHRQHSNKSIRSIEVDHDNLKRHLNSDMKVSLGNYVLQKLTARIWKKAALSKLVDNMEMKRSSIQGKLLKLLMVPQEPVQTERKDKKKSKEFFEYQEEIETESDMNNSVRGQTMHRGLSNSALPIEYAERSSRTAEDWAELFIKKVELDAKREKALPKLEVVENVKPQQKERKIINTGKAATVIQRAFRKYSMRIREEKEELAKVEFQRKAVKAKSVKVEKQSVQENNNLAFEQRDEMVEQLRSELELAKKKMSYLQKENVCLEEKVKNLEDSIEKRVNERLTIERARVKDTLKEYSAFIDKLLTEKKQLEEKSDSQTKLITELCARLDNKSTMKSLKELEDLPIETAQGDSKEVTEYNSIVKEKESLKTKLSAFDTNSSRCNNDLNSRSYENDDLSTSNKPIFEQSGNSLNRSASAKHGVNDLHEENKRILHKGSFSGADENYFQTVSQNNVNLKPAANMYFSTQEHGTDTRKNSEQSQADSANFFATDLYDKKSKDFLFMSADLRSGRQTTAATKGKKTRAEMRSAERDTKSAKDELEFSFEAKTTRNDDEIDFAEPFVLSVALQDRAPKKTNTSVRSTSQDQQREVIQNPLPVLSKLDTRKNAVGDDNERKRSREKLHNARMEKKKNKQHSEQEGLGLELDTLIANLSKRLYIDGGAEEESADNVKSLKGRSGSQEKQNDNSFEKKVKVDSNAGISGSSSSELQREGVEASNKSENIFQRLSRSAQKS